MKKSKHLKNTIICILAALTILLSNMTLYGATEGENHISNELPEEEEITIGDINGDGDINSTDYTLLKRYILGTIDEFPIKNGFAVADLDGDGSINSNDMALLKRYVLGFISEFPASKSKNTVTNSKEVSISLENQPARKGDIITASINIGEISNLAGYGLNIKYNPDVLKPVDSITKNPYKEDTIPRIGDVLADANYEYVTMAHHDLNKGILSFGRTVKDLDEYSNNGNAVTKGVLAEISFEVLEVADIKIEFADDTDNKYWRADTYINKKGVQFFDSNGDSIDVESTVPVNNVNSSPVDNNDLQSGAIELKDVQEHTIEGYIETIEAKDFNVEIYNDEKNIIGSSSTDEKGYFQIKYAPDSHELVTVKISKEGY